MSRWGLGLLWASLVGGSVLAFSNAGLASENNCAQLPQYTQLKSALEKIVQVKNGGIFTPNLMWAAVVDRNGVVCAVVKVGTPGLEAA